VTNRLCLPILNHILGPKHTPCPAFAPRTTPTRGEGARRLLNRFNQGRARRGQLARGGAVSAKGPQGGLQRAWRPAPAPFVPRCGVPRVGAPAPRPDLTAGGMERTPWDAPPAGPAAGRTTGASGDGQARLPPPGLSRDEGLGGAGGGAGGFALSASGPGGLYPRWVDGYVSRGGSVEG
jgi:hypothetical protein